MRRYTVNVYLRVSRALAVVQGELRGGVSRTGGDRRAGRDIAGGEVQRVAAFIEGVIARGRVERNGRAIFIRDFDPDAARNVTSAVQRQQALINRMRGAVEFHFQGGDGVGAIIERNAEVCRGSFQPGSAVERRHGDFA